MKLKTKEAPKATQTKKTTAPRVVKFKQSTLEGIWFGPGETEALMTNGELNRIGRMLHKRGLTDSPDDWWLNDRPVCFECFGRLHTIHPYAYNVMARKWCVKLTQGPDELEEWLEKRPEGHPERTELIEVALPIHTLKRAMKRAKSQGIDNCEDFANNLITAAIEHSKVLLAGIESKEKGGSEQ